MVTDPTWIWRDCEHCGAPFGQPDDPGRKRRFCSAACRTGAYRARKRRQEQADQRQRERQQQDHQANDDAWWQARERYQRQRHQPPPHAGTSRPGTWCGACGGLRGPHTYHHDDAAHARVHRRYEGLRAKAAGTSYPHEADACRAKAEALRDKYGL
jgi:Protein of unknown function (DUF2786)